MYENNTMLSYNIFISCLSYVNYITLFKNDKYFQKYETEWNTAKMSWFEYCIYTCRSLTNSDLL